MPHPLRKVQKLIEKYQRKLSKEGYFSPDTKKTYETIIRDLKDLKKEMKTDKSVKLFEE